jgi:hypothetical protein
MNATPPQRYKKTALKAGATETRKRRRTSIEATRREYLHIGKRGERTTFVEIAT